MSNLYTVRTDRRKSDPDHYRDPRVHHLEEWRRASEDARDTALGQNAFSEAEALYSLKGPTSEVPSFRPAVSVPELQKIILEDANRISDISPQVFIFKGGKQAEQREQALQAAWQQAKVNYHLLYATTTARYCGTGFLQLCYSPDLRNGKGGLWVKSRDPRTVGFDPTTDYEFDPSYLYFDDYMHVEEVRKKWPHTSQNIRTGGSAKTSSTLTQTGSGYGFQMPNGPMTTMPGMPGSSTSIGRSTSDNRVRVTHWFCKDYTREIVDAKNLPDGNLTDPEFKWKYPNGRYMVECEGYILADGSNPYPHRRDIPSPCFPIFPLWALPPLYGPWGVPVTRFSSSLQGLAEKLLTQNYENAVRLNNGVWFIDQATGIDVEAFGGIPGEVQTINPNSRVPECKTAPALSSQAYSMPQDLLKMQRQLQGQTDAKQGNPGAGNISTGLFDSAILQSSGMLQLAGRLQSSTVSQLANCMFDTMGRYMGRYSMPFRGDKSTDIVEWEGILDPHDYDLMMDEDSVTPLSEVALRRMVPELMKTGILNTERGLTMLGVPHADKIALEQKENLELQALARVKSGKKG